MLSRPVVIGVGAGRDRGIDPPLLNPGEIIHRAFQAKLRAELLSNVQLFFFSFLKRMTN